MYVYFLYSVEMVTLLNTLYIIHRNFLTLKCTVAKVEVPKLSTILNNKGLIENWSAQNKISKCLTNYS